MDPFLDDSATQASGAITREFGNNADLGYFERSH